jgi:protease secretion system outer membrane protein
VNKHGQIIREQGAALRLILVGNVLSACSLAAWPLDLMQAYEAAQRNDASIKASRANAEAGRERLPQARAQLLPSVALSATRNKNELNRNNITTGADAPLQSYLSGTANFSARQPLYRPTLMAGYRQAVAQVDDVNASLQRDEQNLAVRVVGAYLDAVATGEQLALVTSQRTFYTAQLDLARKSFAAGAGTRTDVDEVLARLDLGKANEVEAQQNVGFARHQLQVLVGEPVTGLAELNPSRLVLSEPNPASVEAWIAQAEQNSPEMRMLKARLEAADQAVKKAQAGHYPTLDGVLQWSYGDQENINQLNSRSKTTSIGLQLNVPLYAGGYVSSSVRQAVAERASAEQALESMRLDLGVRVHKEYRGIIEGILKVRALEQAVRSADQLVLSSQKSFAAGSRTVVDILNTEQQRTVALRDLAHARYLYLVSRVKLLALVDGINPEMMAEINAPFAASVAKTP